MPFRVTKAVTAALVVVGMAACTGEPNGPTGTETATATPTPAPEVVAQAEELEEVLKAELEEVPDDVRALVRTASITCGGRTF
ncbi:MAG: hypothetical protein Q4G64_08335, partial [bacterium]|nr:hypothetical protein [bacterium]